MLDYELEKQAKKKAEELAEQAFPNWKVDPDNQRLTTITNNK